MDAIIILFVVLAIIIVYSLIRLRVMLRNMPGATSKMNSIELIKNWQEQKAKEAQRLNELREKAKIAAQPKIEEALIKKFTQEEIDKATGVNKSNALKKGLGIDTDKVFSKENIDRVTGRGQSTIKPLDPGVDSSHIFDKEKIQQMAKGNITPERIKKASGHINYEEGLRRGLDSESQFIRLRRAVKREREKDL